MTSGLLAIGLLATGLASSPDYFLQTLWVFLVAAGTLALTGAISEFLRGLRRERELAKREKELLEVLLGKKED